MVYEKRAVVFDFERPFPLFLIYNRKSKTMLSLTPSSNVISLETTCIFGVIVDFSLITSSIIWLIPAENINSGTSCLWSAFKNSVYPSL